MSAIFALIAGIPLFFSYLLLKGAETLGEEHVAFKFFCYFGSVPPLFWSFNLAIQGAQIAYPPLDDAIIDATAEATQFISYYWAFMLTYMIIYLLITAFNVAMQKKKAKLEYE